MLILRLGSGVQQTPAVFQTIIIASVGGVVSTLMCANMRKKLFTDTVLAQIPRWMREEGLGPSELAARIGCTVGSLRVACSRYGLSLRRHSHKPRSREHYYNQAPQLDEFVLALAEEIRDRLRARAAALGMSEVELLALLIETIDRDDLYSAILDDGR